MYRRSIQISKCVIPVTFPDQVSMLAISQHGWLASSVLFFFFLYKWDVMYFNNKVLAFIIYLIKTAKNMELPIYCIYL